MLASAPCTLVLALLAPGDASAGLWTGWETTPACVATEQLGPRIDALTGGAGGPARLSLGAVEVEQGWRISLRIEDASRSIARTVEGSDCATLTDAVALIVAVQIDAFATNEAVTRRITTDGPGWPEPRATAAPERGPSEAGSTSPESGAIDRTDAIDRPGSTPRRGRLALGAALAAELGVLPRGAASVEPYVGGVWPRGRLELGGLASLGPDGHANEQPSVGGHFRLLAGLLRGCGVLGREPLTLPLCAAFEAGILRGQGRGLLRPSTVDAPWLAATLGARPRFSPGPRWAVGGLVDIVVPITRHRFSTVEGLVVHTVSPVATRFGLSVELRLP